jgi:anti-anti-sigma regulatory factor
MTSRQTTVNNRIEIPEGRLGRVELHDLAMRLGQLTHDTRELTIDWQNVNHVDFRGLSEIAAQLRRLQDRGVTIQCSGFSPYVLAIWRYALSIEGLELVSRLAGGFERLPAQDRMNRLGGFAPIPSSWGISEN